MHTVVSAWKCALQIDWLYFHLLEKLNDINTQLIWFNCKLFLYRLKGCESIEKSHDGSVSCCDLTKDGMETDITVLSVIYLIENNRHYANDVVNWK